MISAGSHLPHATRHSANTARHTPPASRLPVPVVRNSTSLWIEHVGGYWGGVEFSTGSFWLIENPEFVEALANRRLQVWKLWLIEGS